MSRNAIWLATGVVIGVLMIAAIWLFPHVDAALLTAMGQRANPSDVAVTAAIVLTIVVVTAPVAAAFYLVASAIGRRLEFRNSDLTWS